MNPKKSLGHFGGIDKTMKQLRESILGDDYDISEKFGKHYKLSEIIKPNCSFRAHTHHIGIYDDKVVNIKNVHGFSEDWDEKNKVREALDDIFGDLWFNPAKGQYEFIDDESKAIARLKKWLLSVTNKYAIPMLNYRSTHYEIKLYNDPEVRVYVGNRPGTNVLFSAYYMSRDFDGSFIEPK